MAHFLDLKNRAKQRGHEFTITFEQYLNFWTTSGYAEKHGKTGESLSVDRIENALGYHFWNIQPLLLSSNSRKSFVPYFNGGIMPKIYRSEYLNIERAYAQPLKKLAQSIGERLGFGTVEFWREFRNQKMELYEKDTEQVC